MTYVFDTFMKTREALKKSASLVLALMQEQLLVPDDDPALPRFLCTSYRH